MRITLFGILVVVTLTATASTASALGLSLTAGGGATLSPFQAGSVATGSGALVATTLLPWTLTVKDSGTGAGHMLATGGTCAGSDPQLTSALTVNVTSVAGGFTSAGVTALGATNTTVATGSSALGVATTLTTNYSQALPATQVMRTGCLYSLTATYTLQ